MRILICYATTEGQTRKICRFCADQLFALGHAVELLAVTDAEPLELATCDAAILAGSVHGGRLQSELAGFATAHGAALNTLPTMFLQVSLAAAGKDPGDWHELRRIAAGFCDDTGWRPDAIHHVAGAFRFSQYDFVKSWAMRWIASQRDQDVDPHADAEYTDWAALADILRGWPALSDGAGRALRSTDPSCA
ncbi:flavodoxin domain-containing protein [Sedimentitalea sp. HM32M-2]|uniref:flavodoxin domain-containing protein n=1 Tax=Sedimentitalea sp. HM32M-2 TaxID=3351566 RepID=UPI003636DBFF